MGIAEMAEALEMSRPTTHRYASTLVALDYLEQGPRRKYRLGMRAADPGRVAVNSTALADLPHRYLADLRDRCSCSTGVAVLDGKDIVYVDRARSSWQGQSEVATRLGRGSRLPAKSTAMGLTLLAHLPSLDQVEGIEDPASRGAGTPHKKLVSELERIRSQGYAIADQVHVKGLRCVAAPIRSRSGEVVAAVEIVAAKSSYSRARILEQLVPLLAASAKDMSRHLGYHPEGSPDPRAR
jgi:IclR family transcriptional regulator, pca regulon regulatory protein